MSKQQEIYFNLCEIGQDFELNGMKRSAKVEQHKAKTWLYNMLCGCGLCVKYYHLKSLQILCDNWHWLVCASVYLFVINL